MDFLQKQFDFIYFRRCVQTYNCTHFQHFKTSLPTFQNIKYWLLNVARLKWIALSNIFPILFVWIIVEQKWHKLDFHSFVPKTLKSWKNLKTEPSVTLFNLCLSWNKAWQTLFMFKRTPPSNTTQESHVGASSYPQRMDWNKNKIKNRNNAGV